jgi:hypothetical protein
MARWILLLALLASSAAATDEVEIVDSFDSYATGTWTAPSTNYADGMGWNTIAANGTVGWFPDTNLTNAGGYLFSPSIGASSGVYLRTLTGGSTTSSNGFMARQFASTLSPSAGSDIWIAFKMQGTGLVTVYQNIVTNDNLFEFLNTFGLDPRIAQCPLQDQRSPRSHPLQVQPSAARPSPSPVLDSPLAHLSRSAPRMLRP